jgi:hypothetical protein
LEEVTALLNGYAIISEEPSDRDHDEADLMGVVVAPDALLASLPRANLQLVR